MGGGVTTTGAQSEVMNCYDLATNTIYPAPSLSSARTGIVAAVINLSDRSLALFVGGYNGYASARVDIYEMNTLSPDCGAHSYIEFTDTTSITAYGFYAMGAAVTQSNRGQSSHQEKRRQAE